MKRSNARHPAREAEAKSLRILADTAAARAAAGQGIPAAEVLASLDQWATEHGHPLFDPAQADPSLYLDDDTCGADY